VQIITPDGRTLSLVVLATEEPGQMFSPASPVTIMYLSPLLEMEPPQDIEFVLARNIARIELGLLRSSNWAREAEFFNYKTRSEPNVDQLVESWGFSKPEKWEEYHGVV
jgi:hypothetical protein